MKWALLIFMFSSFQETNLELVKTLEMETERLCKKGMQVFKDENKRSDMRGNLLFTYKTFCVQVRE